MEVVGRRSHSAHFTVVVTPLPSFQAAVVVSKKVAKKAVDRNTLKRRAYGALEAHKATTAGCIVLYKPGSLKVSRMVLKAELEALLAQSLKSR